MSSIQTDKIQFLIRMNKFNDLFRELKEFLVAEKVITKDIAKAISARVPEIQAQEIYLILSKDNDKLQMVDWEWTVLPKEHMKLTLVTYNCTKEFSYAG